MKHLVHVTQLIIDETTKQEFKPDNYCTSCLIATAIQRSLGLRTEVTFDYAYINTREKEVRVALPREAIQARYNFDNRRYFLLKPFDFELELSS